MQLSKTDISTPALSGTQHEAVIRFLQALVDQDAARQLVAPYATESGFWFGGGNMVEDGQGQLWLVGRYRNVGDSRTGLEMGARGLECALFLSQNGGKSFEKAFSWTKKDLSLPDYSVKSIEGTSLHQLPNGAWELLISTEKEIHYPDSVRDYQKPGTGVWTIDAMRGELPTSLDLSTLRTVIENQTIPGYLHVKDPVSYISTTGQTHVIFCSHPFTWASSNTGLATRTEIDGEFQVNTWEMVSRGPNWDVAATRITDRLIMPSIGVLEHLPQVSVYFYDGAECMREISQNKRGKQRPRGYSCEEIGGAFVQVGDGELTRLSTLEPLFISPHGTGCSRYISTCKASEGIWATWQQSQPDQSQPSVGNYLSNDDIKQLLS